MRNILCTVPRKLRWLIAWAIEVAILMSIALIFRPHIAVLIGIAVVVSIAGSLVSMKWERL